MNDGLVNAILCDEPVDDDWASLSNSVAPVLRLQVLLRVPIGVVDDARVGCRQVDPQATGAGADQEQHGLLVGEKPLDFGLPIVKLGPSVQLAVPEPLHYKTFGNEVKDSGELAEDEHFVAATGELFQKLMENLHFATTVNQYLITWIISEVATNVRMVASSAKILKSFHLISLNE